METPRDVHLDWVPRDTYLFTLSPTCMGSSPCTMIFARPRADFGQFWVSFTKQAFWIEDYPTADLPIVVDFEIF